MTTPQPATRERERLLTPGEVAALFRVDPKTVTRWGAAGRLHSIRTPGGHRRFLESEVMALLGVEPTPAAPTADRSGYTPEVAAANNRGGR